MDAGRTQGTPGAETEEFTVLCAEGSMSVCISVSVSRAPQAPQGQLDTAQMGALHTVCLHRSWVTHWEAFTTSIASSA